MSKTAWCLMCSLLVSVRVTATPIDPRTVYAPTPDWTPPALDITPAPDQERDWVKPLPCDPRNPYWTVDCWTDAVPPAPLVPEPCDDELLPAVVEAVPEPGALLSVVGLLAALWRRR